MTTSGLQWVNVGADRFRVIQFLALPGGQVYGANEAFPSRHRTRRDKPADAQCDQIVQDGPGGAELAADMDNIVDGQTGFDGDFRGRIDLQVAVEAEKGRRPFPTTAMRAAPDIPWRWLGGGCGVCGPVSHATHSVFPCRADMHEGHVVALGNASRACAKPEAQVSAGISFGGPGSNPCPRPGDRPRRYGVREIF